MQQTYNYKETRKAPLLSLNLVFSSSLISSSIIKDVQKNNFKFKVIKRAEKNVILSTAK